MNTKTQTAQHTPGPWTIAIGRKASGIFPFRVVAAHGQEICRLHASYEANAIFIAAAPKVLEMLREAEQYIQDADDDLSQELARRCRAAIAKATWARS